MQYDDSLCLNLMTQLNLMKGKVTKELEQLKSLSLKIQEATSKNVAVTEKNGRQYVRHTNQGHLPTKVTPVIDLTDEPVIQCDVPVIKNNFVDDCKQMIKMTTNNRYKLLQINFDVNTFIYCLGTNFVQSFIFLKIKGYNLIQLILFATK